MKRMREGRILILYHAHYVQCVNIFIHFIRNHTDHISSWTFFHQSPHEIFSLLISILSGKLFMNFDNNNKIYLYVDINADVVNASFEIMKIFSSFSESFNGVIIVNKIDFRSTSLCYGHGGHLTLKGHHPISLRPLTPRFDFYHHRTQTTSIKKSWLKIKLLRCA